MTTARGRGRPKGSIKKGDGKHLDAVADLLVRNPGMKKTPAIAKIVQQAFPDKDNQWRNIERRLQRSWNKTEDERLAAANERRQETQRTRSSYNLSALTATQAVQNTLALALQARNTMTLAEQALNITPPTAIQRALEDVERMRRLQDLANPPLMHHINSIVR